jgi:hypothetical protein
LCMRRRSTSRALKTSIFFRPLGRRCLVCRAIYQNGGTTHQYDTTFLLLP